MPGRRFAARLLQNPVADRNDEPGLLRQRDERGRQDQTPLRMLPAHERLETDDLPADFSLRLVIQAQFVTHQSLAQIELHGMAFTQVQVHGGLEETRHAATIRLGAIQSGIRMAHQCLCIRTVARESSPRRC